MLNDLITDYVEHPEKLTRESCYELRMIVARYPYFQTARLLLLNNLFLLHDTGFGDELRKAALYVADRRVLFELFEGYNNFTVSEEALSQEPSLDRTLSLIDSFLSSLPEENNPQNVETNTYSDYAATYLLDVQNDEDEVRLRGQELIDVFIANGPDKIQFDSSTEEENVTIDDENTTVEENWDEDVVEESFFTETLARIYIKQKKYSQALEIIRKLNLEYPNKNRYFADQIRFLEKIIVNSKTE